MKQKPVETILYSLGGIAAVFVIVVAVNYITGLFKARIDLTADHLYTLTAGTKAILAKIEEPIEIRFYYTQGDRESDAALGAYAQRIEDLLGEYRELSKGKIVVRKLNPQPDSDPEDLARQDGIAGQPLPTGDTLYFGLAVSKDPEKEVIPFLDPRQEKLIEYDISQRISAVITPQKVVVGVMSALPVFGQPANPMMMRMGQQGQDPWFLISELKRRFTVREVPMTAESIEPDVKVLLVIHPKDISDGAQYAIDQFVMRGGRLVAFLDAMSLVDRPANPSNPMMANMPGGPSSLAKLLEVWGIKFENSQVVADPTFATKLSRGEGNAESVATFLSLNKTGIDSEDVLTRDVDLIMIPFGGVFSGTPAEGLKQTVLLKTTKQSQMVDGFMASMSSQQVMKDFKPSGKEQALAIRLTGKFKTAFPNGKPAAKPPSPDEDKKDKPPDTGAESLKETKVDNLVILVGDSDCIFDQFAVRAQNFFGQKLVQYINGNLNLAQSMVELMAGDSNLIAVRSRATLNRPFEVVQQLQAAAEERHRDTVRKLEEGLAETQRKLNELQQVKKEGGQRFVLSPEQQAEVEKFRRQESQSKVELKKVRKQLRQDIDSLENRLKWVNIAGMPFIVTVAGLALAGYKRNRARAK